MSPLKTEKSTASKIDIDNVYDYFCSSDEENTKGECNNNDENKDFIIKRSMKVECDGQSMVLTKQLKGVYNPIKND